MNPSKRLGVIDLGTNTFHLLIADVGADGTIKEVFRERRFVKLASEGIATIGPAPFQRGLSALEYFRGVIDDHKVESLKAFGTAALRTASNGDVFVRTAELEHGIIIQLIPGDEEARLITRGVLAALPPLEERVLIMDIGGGSVEFILASPEGVHWRRSFGIGISVLLKQFHHSDPISESEIGRIEAFLTDQLQPLRDALVEYPTRHLVGAAGTFDVLGELLRDHDAPAHPTSHALKLDRLDEFYFGILASSTEDRLKMPGLPEERADMIVSAMVLLRFVMRMIEVERVTVSDWAMKEGILLEDDHYKG